MRTRVLVLSALLLTPASRATLAGDDTYRDPPAPIPRILDASQPPLVVFSPRRTWMLLLDRASLPPIAELAAPWVPLAGSRIDPTTNGPAREDHERGMSLQRTGPQEAVRVELPQGARIGNVAWSRDERHVAFTLTQADGIEPWVLDVETRRARRLAGPTLNGASGSPCAWIGAGEALACRFVPEGRGPAPERSRVPTGPVIEESSGRKSPARTYTNLLRDAHDEALFDHYMTSVVERLELDGRRTRLHGPALVTRVDPSPDGRYLLVQSIHRPYSHSLPVERFPLRVEVLDVAGRSIRKVADLALADEVPVTYDSVRTGPRRFAWRDDRPATLTWAEALDGGDARAKADVRDVVMELAAPFDGAPRELWRTALRYRGVTWGRDDLALLDESWWATRRTRTWIVDPSAQAAPPRLLWDRDSQDAYGDPGSPLTVSGPHGSVLHLPASGASLLLSGRGASSTGLHPFLDELDLATGRSRRLWQAADPYFESVVDALDEGPLRFVTRRESQEEPPNYWLRTGDGGHPVRLTSFADPAPELAGVTKRLLRYRRDDGVELSATLFLPPGHEPGRDAPLPTFFWAYPAEFKSRESAGQVTSSPNRFSRPTGASPLFLLTQGWALVDNPTFPIVGEGDQQPNDKYVEQLVASARAAVDHVVALGVADPERCAFGGHSYGAFTAANLLAHSDLFRAAVARSGAYNRTLTPFSFQGEERHFWEATSTYVDMSPFTHAARIDEPLLLVHGAEDSNAGTYPIQSERLYEAVKGLGGTVRLVKLPDEDHGYRARESCGHVLWETIDWLDRHVKQAAPRSKGETSGAPSGGGANALPYASFPRK